MELFGSDKLGIDFKVQILFGIIEDETSITKTDMKRNSRKREVVHARRIFWVILKQHTLLTLVQMGEYLKKDHVTVLHNLRKHEHEIAIYSDYSHKYTRIYKMTEALFISKTIFSVEYYENQIKIFELQKNEINNSISLCRNKIKLLKHQKDD